jgi:hypothetical protein
VLGFRDQVHRDPPGIRRIVGQHDCLGGTGGQSHVYPVGQGSLGSGYVQAARTEYLVHLGDAFRAKSQGGDSLNAANPVHLFNPAYLSCVQAGRIDIPPSVRRRDRYDPLDSGYGGGNHLHVHHRGKAPPSTRDVQPGGGNGGIALACKYAGADLAELQTSGALLLMNPTHALHGEGDGLFQLLA